MPCAMQGKLFKSNEMFGIKKLEIQLPFLTNILFQREVWRQTP